MRTDVVFTLTGPDRVGIVEQVTKALLSVDGNVGSSRMARLGGEFAILMLVSLPEGGAAKLDAAFADMIEAGYKITTSETRPEPTEYRAGGVAYRVEVSGADHEGIIHDIAAGLSEAGINIESMETRIVSAPVSGTPLFTMTALVLVPRSLEESVWIGALDEAAARANVDVEVAVAE